MLTPSGAAHKLLYTNAAGAAVALRSRRHCLRAAEVGGGANGVAVLCFALTGVRRRYTPVCVSVCGARPSGVCGDL